MQLPKDDLAVLKLPLWVFNRLRRNGYHTISQLRSEIDEYGELVGGYGIGDAVQREVKEALAESAL